MKNLPQSRRSILTVFALGAAVSLTAWAARAADEAKSSSAAGSGEKVALFNGKDLSGWKTSDAKAISRWKAAADAKLNEEDPKRLAAVGAAGGEGSAMVLEQAGGGADVFTDPTFGDGEYHVEVMVPKGSNSGVYLQGQYEVQVFDSYGKEKVNDADMGAIYSTKAPSENASKAPGEWQTFDITFRAPRFDAAGKKTENAKFIKVVLNGKTIQENVEAPRPTGSQLPGGERAKGPLMLQGDHGSVAFRNLWVKPADAK
jgi:hypothetical protein